jgi:NADH-quinone oxidoreductase subunit M
LLLTLLIVVPLAGAVLTALAPKSSWAKAMALIVAIGVWILAIPLWTGFDSSDGGFQFSVDAPLIPLAGIRFHLGLDGISLWLVQLTVLLTPLVALGSFKTIQKAERGFYSLLLLLEATLLGTFLSLDLVLFYIFWELMLIPMFFIIGIWGGAGRVYASLKFVLFTMVGSLPMLIAVLWIGHAGKTFDYVQLLQNRLPPDVQFWCFLICALAFMIKLPVVPLHTWLPDAHTEAPAGGSVMLAGVLLKMGAYGLMRICIPLFPDASQDFAPLMLVLGVVGIVYGALVAAAQTDMKRLVAYSSVSHMGFILLAIFTFNMQALQGGVLQMVSHGLTTGALFFLVGMVYERTHTRKIEDLGGLAKVTPVLAAAFLFASLSSMALPGLCGFVGEFLILSSAWTNHPILTAIATTGVILGAWYLLSLFGRVFLGPLKHEEHRALKDLSLREGLVLAPILALILFIGVKPTPFLAPTEKSIQMTVLSRLTPPPLLMDYAAQEKHNQEHKSPKLDERRRP